jgi:hypothetical protein
MLAVASAYSDLLDLCLYFYCLCLLLSCSVVTPPNLVVVVEGGGVLQVITETDNEVVLLTPNWRILTSIR